MLDAAFLPGSGHNLVEHRLRHEDDAVHVRHDPVAGDDQHAAADRVAAGLGDHRAAEAVLGEGAAGEHRRFASFERELVAHVAVDDHPGASTLVRGRRTDIAPDRPRR